MKTKIQRLLCIVFFSFFADFCDLSAGIERKTPTVSTSSGEIKGTQKYVLGKNINTYLGIPFAKPPLGELRFKRPEPLEAWDSTVNAFDMPKACMQPDVIGSKGPYANEIYNFTETGRTSEDCLYLNIWEPHRASNAAVMLWIHGGALWFGSAAMHDGKYLAATHDVIVVVIQYRLGAFGFLYLGNDDVPGNAGLWDQHMAIKWTYDNIGRFGGDKERITLFGLSSGGSSGQLLSLSEQPKYFKNVITQSAASLELSSFKMPLELQAISTNLAGSLGCEGPDAARCLRSLDADHITKTLHEKQVRVSNAVTIDNLMFTKHPRENYKDVRNVNFIVGTNKFDGYFVLLFFLQNFPLDKPDISEDDFFRYLQVVTSLKNATFMKEISEKYRDEYPEYIDRLQAMVGDIRYHCLRNDMAREFSTYGNAVYVYHLDHRSSACLWPVWHGAGHICDMDLVFGLPYSGAALYADLDRQVSAAMMKYWTNFAKTGYVY